MSILMSPSFIIAYISFCNFAIISILKDKVNKSIANLISGIVILPVIPLFWLIGYENNLHTNNFYTFASFYLPLIVTIAIISMLVTRIVKFREA